MKQRLTAKILLCFMLIFTMSSNVFAADTVYDNSANGLLSLGVINKSEVKAFKSGNSISKAQFLKMVIVAMGKSEEAAASKKSTIFSDVNANYWASGYINVAVKNKIISGYSDGTFRPGEELSYTQALVVLVKALGYETGDLPGVWPRNYTEKANSLKIAENTSFKPESKLSQRDAVVLVYKTVSIKIKNSEKTLAEAGGFGTTKTVIILNSSDIDKSLPKNTVKTDIGDFKSKTSIGTDYLGKKVNVLVDSKNNIIAVQDIVKDGEALFVNEITGNKVSYSQQSEDKSIEIPDNMPFYYKGLKQVFKDVRNNVVQGSIVSLINDEETDQFEYGVLTEPPLSEPVVTEEDFDTKENIIANIDISDKDQFSVVKNGEKASFSDIKMNDVVYFIKNPFRSQGGLFKVYDNKKTGIYTEAIPSKNSVKKIKLLGQEYEIETSQATSKLNDSRGAFDIDQEITILTGAAGKIVDVITPSTANVSNMGIVINTRKGSVTPLNTLENDIYYAKIYKTDGTVAEYRTEEDESVNKGKLVRFRVNNGVVSLIPVNRAYIDGYIDKNEKKIGEKWLSQTAIILDLYNINDAKTDVVVRKINWIDMPSHISQDMVLNSVTGGPFDDLQVIVLNNLYGPSQYGVLSEQSTEGNNKLYSIMSNGKTENYTVTGNPNSIMSGVKGDVVFYETGANKLTKLSLMSPVEKSDKIQAVDSRRIRLNNKIYLLSYDVQVYDLSESNPKKVEKQELSASDIKYTALYLGNQSNLIKVITIIKK